LPLDLVKLYRKMYHSRYFEQAVAALWQQGKISGEMHLSMGEEAICAGINDHLRDGDALALDHRGTAPLLMRGVEPLSLMKELLGKSDGLCGGQGGHMHLFEPDFLAASSGIVGATGPAAAGFALAARYLRRGKIAVSYFGEGAINQGMLMESCNLAAAWQLPVLFVCKDNQWSITTRSETVTGGKIIDRVRAFGMSGDEIDGSSVAEVWETAGKVIDKIRRQNVPAFIQAHCVHLEGHFLGDPLIQLGRRPFKKIQELGGPLVKSILHLQGANIKNRTNAIHGIGSAMLDHIRADSLKKKDPVRILREKLAIPGQEIENIERAIEQEIDTLVIQATATET